MKFFNGKCQSKARLDGITAIVTGCDTGIGKETVADFYRRGARVIMACQSLKRAEVTKDNIVKKYEDSGGEILITRLDLASLHSVRQCADHIISTESKVNLLINNAGILRHQGKSEDGFDLVFATNYLGHFLLTLLLLPKIIDSKPARIVNVSSMMHFVGHIHFEDIHYENRTYNASMAYAQSKLAIVLFTKELAKRLRVENIEGVNVYSLHPGVANTSITQDFDRAYFPGVKRFLSLGNVFKKSPKSGAQTTIYCAVDEKCSKETGLYYSDCAIANPSKEAKDSKTAEKLWEISMKSARIHHDPFRIMSY